MLRYFHSGFPLLLSQFPESPQFRPPAWFCVSAGVLVLLFQFLLFHGESEFNKYQKYIREEKKGLPACTIEDICRVFVSFMLLLHCQYIKIA